MVTPLIFVFWGNNLSFRFAEEHTSLLFTILGLFLVGAGFFSWEKKHVPSIRNILRMIVYAGVFAFPEEIIFRGVIQTTLQQYFGMGVTAFLLPSVFFGIAHLYNGSKSFHPRNWNFRLALITSLAGIPLGLLFMITESLLLPILFHAILLILMQMKEENVI